MSNHASRDKASATRANLEEKWLPRLRTIEKRRESYCALILYMILCLSLLMLASIAPSLYAFATGGELDTTRIISILGAFGTFITVLTIIMLKVQSCNDILVGIEFFIYTGDHNGISAALNNLGCLGEMKEMVHDIAGLAKLAA